MKLTSHPIHGRKLTGFTLIELLVVIIIIAALAALVVPNVGSFGRSTDMAVSAKTQADIANNVQQFFVLQKRFPQGLDSLITTTGTAPAVPGEIYLSDATNGDTQTRGLPISGAESTDVGAQLDALTLTGNDLKSITRAGFDWVYDHDITALNSNISNTTQRILVKGANGSADTVVVPPTKFAVVKVDSNLAKKIVPAGLKTGQQIVAFGFGQKNTAISKTSTTTPLYPGADKTYYGRYIVYFMIYASGERATLVGVSDAYGRTPDYTQQQFNESLPDGARQG